MMPPLWAISFQNIKKEKWDHLDVVWIEDYRVPTFSIQIYFADGALSDSQGMAGETDYMFTGLFWGTNRFEQKEINNNLEYFGSKHNFQVFHEYSSLSFSGLNRDIIPITKKYCHLFSDSVYPKKEVVKYTRRMKSRLTNLVTNHSQLANHVFRRLSLRGTAFELPVEGTLRSINRIRPSYLQKKRDYFNRRVKKKLYLRGNKDILRIKDIILGECGWGKSSESFVRTVKGQQTHQTLKTKIVLIPVKGANQAQIRMGRFLNKQDIQGPELLSLISGYIGGNFISLLNDELRTKRGLVYSVSSFAQGQKYYGRSSIVTFSRNEKVKEALEVIKEMLNKVEKGEINQGRLQKTVNFLKGGHLFQFESDDSFLRTLMFFDHIGRNWSDLYNYPLIIDKFSMADVALSTGKIFGWDHSLIVIIGDKSLVKELKKIDSIQVLDYKTYL